MIDKAIAKLTQEMMEANDPVIQMIEEHLTEVCTTDEIAEKILAEGKTLKGALEEIENAARERRKGHKSCICVSDAEGFRITDKYFDIMHLIGKAKQEQDNINILDLI